MEKNAARLNMMTLEEMSVLLNIPLETLRENSEASPGELSTPEYWLVWYQKSLATPEEARRANRNFRGGQPELCSQVNPLYPAVTDSRDVGGGVDVVHSLAIADQVVVPVGSLVRVHDFTQSRSMFLFQGSLVVHRIHVLIETTFSHLRERAVWERLRVRCKQGRTIEACMLIRHVPDARYPSSSTEKALRSTREHLGSDHLRIIVVDFNDKRNQAQY
ncbi:hypothetical protein PHMEG_00030126 [Phytophthora megakarya]|uniref:Uncharacterized protein n=1 Tax=Phytophthora megakarya TaxID=4795 RepID=A0A225V2L3_9STRA|nr:hypothetical protein PHMEG_00030126 [Phytophthora megakarya]